MDNHIEKACAGLRKIQEFTTWIPDFFIYCGPTDNGAVIPEAISGIPVIFTPHFIHPNEFNLVCEMWYLPAYKKCDTGHWFGSYKRAYEDYI